MELGSNGIQNKGSGAPKPDGVLFKTIEPSQYTSYRTGDEGWRAQNGLFDYTPPISPKVVAQLDYSLGANYWARLTQDISVGGVANKLRFVDVDGGQTFSLTGNKNLITIDKLTGLGFTRTNVGNAANWNTAIDNALTHSIVVNGVTYNDFYLYCLNEGISFFGTGRTNQNLIDPITLVNLQSASNGASVLFTSTTNEINTAQMYNLENVNFIKLENKAGVTRQLFVFNARNLITAP